MTKEKHIDRHASSADSSRDSAVQYVAFDLLESGFGPEEQRELLTPVEEEIQQHINAILHDGMRRSFHSDPSEGAKWAIGQIVDRLSYDDVPEEHRDELSVLVEERLHEKQNQLEMSYQEIKEEALRKAGVVPAEEIVEWGAVV